MPPYIKHYQYHCCTLSIKNKLKHERYQIPNSHFVKREQVLQHMCSEVFLFKTNYCTEQNYKAAINITQVQLLYTKNYATRIYTNESNHLAHIQSNLSRNISRASNTIALVATWKAHKSHLHCRHTTSLTRPSSSYIHRVWILQGQDITKSALFLNPCFMTFEKIPFHVPQGASLVDLDEWISKRNWLTLVANRVPKNLLLSQLHLKIDLSSQSTCRKPKIKTQL